MLTRETNNMDIEENVLANYINLINIGNGFINLQMDFIFSDDDGKDDDDDNDDDNDNCNETLKGC